MKPLIPKKLKYAYLKFIRHRDTPEAIGRGAAIGCFTAFFIPFSMQMPIALLLAIRLRATCVAALSFTWITNPITILFIYPLQCYIGSRIAGIPLSSPLVASHLAELVEKPSIKHLATVGSELFTSFLIGGLLFGSIAAIVAYYTSISWIRWRRNFERKRRQQLSTTTSTMSHRIESTTFAG